MIQFLLIIEVNTSDRSKDLLEILDSALPLGFTASCAVAAMLVTRRDWDPEAGRERDDLVHRLAKFPRVMEVQIRALSNILLR